MSFRLTKIFLPGFLGLMSFMARPLPADEWNKRIDFQFSAPVQIPGHTLAAGKYVFQLADGDSNRVVEIYSEDSSGHESLVTTLMTIPAYIATTPDTPVVHFEERPSGSPEAIHSWFYPGENAGWEFVYPNTPAVGAE